MRRLYWIVLPAMLAVGLSGCGDSADSGENRPPDDGGVQTAVDDGPAKTEPGPGPALAEFLEAMRDGNNEKTSLMLTAAARRTAAELQMHIEPPGSDTAEFEIGKIEYIAEDAARVACTLSDLDENALRRSEDVVWMMRREPEGWRIAGVAAFVVELNDVRAVDFEDRRHMEAMKDAQQGPPQAQRPPQPAQPIRR